MNFSYQQYALDRIRNQDKSCFIWFRQSGKSTVIVDALIEYINLNSNKIIYVFSYSNDSAIRLQRLMHQKMNIRAKKQNLSKINNCEIIFKSYQRLNDNIYGSSNLVIVDDVGVMTDRSKDIMSYILKNTDKIILTSSMISDRILKTFDNKHDYYLNIISSSDILSKKAIKELIMQCGSMWMYNMSNEFSMSDILEVYDKKDRNLIEFWGIKQQRKLKLKQLNESW